VVMAYGCVVLLVLLLLYCLLYLMCTVWWYRSVTQRAGCKITSFYSNHKGFPISKASIHDNTLATASLIDVQQAVHSLINDSCHNHSCCMRYQLQNTR
jgi:hypothetical protein